LADPLFERFFMDMHEGINIIKVDENAKREDLPKEVRDMYDAIDVVIHGLFSYCDKNDVHITLMPCILLHAFNKITPMFVDSIMKSNNKVDVQIYLDGLRGIVENSFKINNANKEKNNE